MADNILILYVDDETPLLDIGKLFLEQSADFSVDTTLSALTALEILKTKTYDCIVSDYHMPKMDGISFLKAVRVSHGDLPFILFTGRGREEVVINAINNGADFYLQKGGDAVPLYTELAHKIRQAVAGRRATEKLRAAYEQIAASEEELRSQLDDLVENQEALKRSEEKFRDIVETSPEQIWEMDTEGTFTYMSPSSVSTLGYPPEDIVGKTIFSILTGPAREGFREIFFSGNRTRKQVNEYNLPMVRQDGQVIFMETRSVPLFDRKGQFTGFRGTARDVTDRKRAEEALRASEEKFRALVENSLDGIIITDSSGTILFANQAIGTIIRAENYRSFIGKKNVLDFIAPEFRSDVIADLGRVFCGQDAYLVCYKLITENQQDVWAECIGKKILFGRTPAMLVSVRDITSRRLIEGALKKANEKLNILSDITRHDIVNSLLTLDAFVSLLEETVADRPDSLDLLARARAESRKIGEQIRFTKDYQDLGVKLPVWQNITTIAKMAAYENIPDTIALDLITGDYEIFADPMFMLVFYNLMDNTKRHGERVTKISISFTVSGSDGLLIIEDDGVGVPADLKDLIFEKNMGKHTGLGLFLSREILAITDITIRENGIPGQGARFELLVPQGRFRRHGAVPPA
jgi:PAS domain S-box-containing protein